MPESEDRELLERFVEGDPAAFESLFRSHEGEVFRWVVRVVRDAGAAEDALVEAFLRAYRGRARFDPSRSFGAWMRRIATNADAYHRYYFEVPNQFVLGLPAYPLDRAFLFPMAVVPNAWGLWNVLHLALRSRLRLPLGVFGALLVLLLVPGGVALARLFDSFGIQMQFALPMIPIGMGVYYLAWKYFVRFLNEELGIG